jgi:hypothetical protein
MLTAEQKSELHQIVTESLNEAERVWKNVGVLFEKSGAWFAADSVKSLTTQIPGYETIIDRKPEVDDFICIVVDMRDSTDHLMQAISKKITSVSQLQRIFYETSALLPAIAKVIGYYDGKVTEYLGDGVLGMFLASGGEDDRSEAVRQASRAARGCLECARCIVNPALEERYGLPPLSIGIGLAFSRAIIMGMGLPGYRLPKVFGECVFYATKLSKLVDKIAVDKNMNNIWPQSNGGKLTFQKKAFHGWDGYVMSGSD